MSVPTTPPPVAAPITGLVLARTEGQSIVIIAGGREIVVEVIKIDGRRARLRIRAPADVAVNREEVHNIKQRRESPWKPMEVA